MTKASDEASDLADRQLVDRQPTDAAHRKNPGAEAAATTPGTAMYQPSWLDDAQLAATKAELTRQSRTMEHQAIAAASYSIQANIEILKIRIQQIEALKSKLEAWIDDDNDEI